LLDLMNEVEFVLWIKCLIEMSNKTIETDCHVEKSVARLSVEEGLNHFSSTFNDFLGVQVSRSSRRKCFSSSHPQSYCTWPVHR
jgi:hypothetical protein